MYVVMYVQLGGNIVVGLLNNVQHVSVCILITVGINYILDLKPENTTNYSQLFLQIEDFEIFYF